MSDLEKEFFISGNKVLDASSRILLSTDGGNLEYFNFDRYIPNAFRFYLSSKYCSYEEMLLARDPNGSLLRELLQYGFIYSFNWEIILATILLKDGDSPEVIYQKNFLRNNFLKFALLCEKANIFKGQGKNNCGNFIVPWETYYNVYIIPQSIFIPTPPVIEIQKAQTQPLTFQQMSAIYNIGSTARQLSFLTYETYTPKSIIPSNFFNKFVPSNPCEIPYTYFTFITLPDYVNTGLDLFNALYNASEMILQGKNPGIPSQFQEYFTYDIASYYYSFYNPIIISREKLLSMDL